MAKMVGSRSAIDAAEKFVDLWSKRGKQFVKGVKSGAYGCAGGEHNWEDVDESALGAIGAGRKHGTLMRCIEEGCGATKRCETR